MTRSIWSPKGNETSKINISKSPHVSNGGIDMDYLSSKFVDISKESPSQDYHESQNVHLNLPTHLLKGKSKNLSQPFKQVSKSKGHRK